MKKLCISILVSGLKYQEYIPLFVYSVLRSYKDYSIMVFLCEEVSSPVRKQLDMLEGIGSFKIIENYTCVDKLKNQQIKSLRWILDPPEYKDFDAVYIGDVDIFIVPEEPTLCDQHLKHCRKLGLPYSNALRPAGNKKLPKGFRTIADMVLNVGLLNTLRFIVNKKSDTRQLSGLHFFKTEDYLEKIRPLIPEYNKIILSNDYSNRASTVDHKDGFHNECLLYDLIKESGMSLPPEGPYSIDPKDFEQPCFRPHHGIHLGIFRKQSTIDNSRATLDSECYKEYYKKYRDITKNDPVFASLKTYFSEEIKEQLERLYNYYEQLI